MAVGTVAQRFGNKRGLLVAMSRAAVDSVRGRMRISPERRFPDDPIAPLVRTLVTAHDLPGAPPPR